jgi:hypothetical protein
MHHTLKLATDDNRWLLALLACTLEACAVGMRACISAADVQLVSATDAALWRLTCGCMRAAGLLGSCSAAEDTTATRECQGTHPASAAESKDLGLLLCTDHVHMWCCGASKACTCVC